MPLKVLIKACGVGKSNLHHKNTSSKKRILKQGIGAILENKLLNNGK